jgi:hypothetical protein
MNFKMIFYNQRMLSTGEGRNITGNADGGIAVTTKVELIAVWSFSRDGTYLREILCAKRNLNYKLFSAYKNNNAKCT